MTVRAKLARQLAAALSATALLLLLVLAWDLRPALPPMPQSVSQPLPGRTISAVLDLATWLVAVLLDLALLGRVVRFRLRKRPGRSELRLHRAFARRERPPIARRDWRVHAGPLASPIMRIPPRHPGEPPSEPTQTEREALPEVTPAHATGRIESRDDRAGIRLLGPLELTGCKKKQPRRQATAELLAYLVIQRRPVNRDELLEALWPGDDPRRSAARFYQAASEARKLLGDAFVRERDTYSLDRLHLEIDLDELDWLREHAHDTDEENPALLERALALFRAEPLAGIDSLWADSEQRRLTSLRLSLLERIGRLRLESGDAASALEMADAATTLDGLNEHLVQLAIEAEAALGRRGAVTERYEHLRRDLDERFGLEPSRETKLLYRRLLSQDAA